MLVLTGLSRKSSVKMSSLEYKAAAYRILLPLDALGVKLRMRQSCEAFYDLMERYGLGMTRCTPCSDTSLLCNWGKSFRPSVL